MNMFIVPKKDGGQRPVINLKYLNKFVKSEHFKMEGLHTVKEKRLDGQDRLEDAIFMVPIAPNLAPSPIQASKEDISIQLSSFQPVHVQL